MEAMKTGNRWSLVGMTALVTGGTKGIGHAIVEELAGLGATVHTCSRTESELNEVLRHWSSLGFQVTGSVCDVTIRSQREKLMVEVSSIFKEKLDILEEDFSYLMSLNVEASYHFCQLAHPLLKASSNGNIVFISSIAGVNAFDVSSIYGATKGAINQITKNLACEWAKDNIRTNCIAPGLTRTPLVERALENEAFLDKFLDRVPLRRIGDPSDISSIVAFVCLPAASYIGLVIRPDPTRFYQIRYPIRHVGFCKYQIRIRNIGYPTFGCRMDVGSDRICIGQNPKIQITEIKQQRG
ncbi:tropinone reductase I [Ranunculus cassubicifolius]